MCEVCRESSDLGDIYGVEHMLEKRKASSP